MGLFRMLEVPVWGFAPWYWFWYGHWSLFHPYSKFWLSILILKMKRTSMSFKSSFWALEDAGGSWHGLGLLILIWTWSLVFDTPMIQFWLCILILKVQRTSLSFKSWFGALENAGGSWLVFEILILIWIWSLGLDLALALSYGYGFWLWLWFVLSRFKKIFGSWLYQRTFTISKPRSRFQTPVRNLQFPPKPQIRT